MKYSGKTRNLGQGVRSIGEPAWVPLLLGNNPVGRARLRDDGDGVDWETNDERVGWAMTHGETAGMELGGQELPGRDDAPKLDAKADPDALAIGKATKAKD